MNNAIFILIFIMPNNSPNIMNGNHPLDFNGVFIIFINVSFQEFTGDVGNGTATGSIDGGND